MKKLVLLDGHAIIHRAFHAIPEKFSTRSGEPTNAVFGFTSILLNVVELEKPDCLAVAFDRKGKTFRHHADANYKATRAKTAPELIAQIRRVYEIVRAFSIPIFSESGFEADDILGGICEKMEAEKDFHTIVVSGDRDLLQLVDAKTSVHDLAGGYRQAERFTPEKVFAKYGFEPKLIPDFKGLAGDASDNLKGVTGIGPKGATDLIQEFGTLENIFANLEKIKPTAREKLERDRDNAFHSKRMATIRRDAQIDFDLAKCCLSDFDRTTVLELFDELEFHSLEKRFLKLFPPPRIEVAKPVEQPRLF
ncbi:MAG: 5'-3' exonuclease H3TH domain-containing protein [Patescibacteria group bacterium]